MMLRAGLALLRCLGVAAVTCRRDNLSSVHTYQVDSPIGLDLKLLRWALKGPPKLPLEWPLSVLALGYLRG